mmetsp:Transcript_9463/g.22794  ORF Transcript_9463/g.22794 Transcript_9463/m.22794 type:complete len:137 (+) Transcript_9463:3-413(+)
MQMKLCAVLLQPVVSELIHTIRRNGDSTYVEESQRLQNTPAWPSSGPLKASLKLEKELPAIERDVCRLNYWETQAIGALHAHSSAALEDSRIKLVPRIPAGGAGRIVCRQTSKQAGAGNGQADQQQADSRRNVDQA